ncbi:hypothetical protein V8E53_007425 [Lactarius tabidus]
MSQQTLLPGLSLFGKWAYVGKMPPRPPHSRTTQGIQGNPSSTSQTTVISPLTPAPMPMPPATATRSHSADVLSGPRTSFLRRTRGPTAGTPPDSDPTVQSDTLRGQQSAPELELQYPTSASEHSKIVPVAAMPVAPPATCPDRPIPCTVFIRRAKTNVCPETSQDDSHTLAPSRPAADPVQEARLADRSQATQPIPEDEHQRRILGRIQHLNQMMKRIDQMTDTLHSLTAEMENIKSSMAEMQKQYERDFKGL